MINFSNSIFKRMIIHRIFKKKPDEECSVCEHEEQLIIAGNDVQDIIKHRINEACGKDSKAFKLQIAKTDENSFFNTAKDIFNVEDNDFISKTKFIGTLLAKAQRRGNIPGGYLLIIEGKSDDDSKFVLVVKAELQEAFKAEKNTATNRVQIEILKDIFLSPADKFFKIGLIYEHQTMDELPPNDAYACLIYDDQFGVNSKPADFFYNDFLGFTLDRNEKILSKGFYEDVKKIVMDSPENYDTKKDIVNALNVLYKRDQTGLVNPNEWGDRYLSGELKDKYAATILTQPKYNRPFTRDTTLMTALLKKRTIFFKNKIQIHGLEENFDENVKIIRTLEEAANVLENQNTQTLVKVNGKPFDNE